MFSRPLSELPAINFHWRPSSLVDSKLPHEGTRLTLGSSAAIMTFLLNGIFARLVVAGVLDERADS